MKKTLIAAALVACAATQLFAQNAKQDVITFQLTRYAQNSVSTAANQNNAGFWSQGPLYYRTTTTKIANSDVLNAIAEVLYRNPGKYGSMAQIVLVQGEMGGFFGYPYNNVDLTAQDSTITGDNIRLATGRNMTNNPITGGMPPGHNQPWGQIYVKTYDSKGNTILCDNVSFFFVIQVQECYDCFYLSSFITDTTFKLTESKGPPCCAGSSVTVGSGKDKYYMTLQFDNTYNNPYLNDNGYYGHWNSVTKTWDGIAESDKYLDIKNSDEFWYEVGSDYGLYGYYYRPSGTDVYGLIEADDGICPDGLPYADSITTTVQHPTDHHAYDIYTLRFSLNGIVTYTWNLKFINKTDVFPDFVGTADFPCTGYGYALKVCSLFDGDVKFVEAPAVYAKCCLDQPWYVPYESVPGPISGEYTNTFWYGIGDNDKGFYPDYAKDTWYTGDVEDYYATSYLIKPGTEYYWHIGDDVPVNTDLDLSFHCNFNHNYEPVEQATEKDYPQPGFEGWNDDYFSGAWAISPAWYNGADPDISPADVQPPQKDYRLGDLPPRSSD